MKLRRKGVLSRIYTTIVNLLFTNTMILKNLLEFPHHKIYGNTGFY